MYIPTTQSHIYKCKSAWCCSNWHILHYYSSDLSGEICTITEITSFLIVIESSLAKSSMPCSLELIFSDLILWSVLSSHCANSVFFNFQADRKTAKEPWCAKQTVQRPQLSECTDRADAKVADVNTNQTYQPALSKPGPSVDLRTGFWVLVVLLP